KKCALHSGHYYYKESRNCPWCGIETHARVRLFNFLLPVGDSQRGHFQLDEIWKEIVSVKPPTPSAQDKLEKAPAVSSEVAGFAEARRSRLIASVAFSSIVGLLISLLAEFPLAFFLLSVTALLACSFAKTKWPGAGKTPQLLQNQQDPPDDPF